MRNVLLNENAAEQVMRIRENKLGVYNDEKCAIADAFAELSDMINIGRDCEEMANCTEGILTVMSVLVRYNTLLNTINGTDDVSSGKFEYVKTERNSGEEIDSSVFGVGRELLKHILEKHSKLDKIYIPEIVDSNTLAEVADILDCSVEELKKELNEFRASYEQGKF